MATAPSDPQVHSASDLRHIRIDGLDLEKQRVAHHLRFRQLLLSKTCFGRLVPSALFNTRNLSFGTFDFDETGRGGKSMMAGDPLAYLCPGSRIEDDIGLDG